MTTLAQDFAEIDANHAVYQRQTAHIELLTIRLRIARGEWVGLRDIWRAKDIVNRYPEFAE